MKKGWWCFGLALHRVARGFMLFKKYFCNLCCSLVLWHLSTSRENPKSSLYSVPGIWWKTKERGPSGVGTGGGGGGCGPLLQSQASGAEGGENYVTGNGQLTTGWPGPPVVPRERRVGVVGTWKLWWLEITSAHPPVVSFTHDDVVVSACELLLLLLLLQHRKMRSHVCATNCALPCGICHFFP
jgi:hypothetical protein